MALGGVGVGLCNGIQNRQVTLADFVQKLLLKLPVAGLLVKRVHRQLDLAAFRCGFADIAAHFLIPYLPAGQAVVEHLRPGNRYGGRNAGQLSNPPADGCAVRRIQRRVVQDFGVILALVHHGEEGAHRMDGLEPAVGAFKSDDPVEQRLDGQNQRLAALPPVPGDDLSAAISGKQMQKGVAGRAVALPELKARVDDPVPDGAAAACQLPERAQISGILHILRPPVPLLLI